MEIKRFTHVGMCVSDLDRSLRFYTDGLGFEVVDKLPIDDQFSKVMEIDMQGEELAGPAGRHPAGAPRFPRPQVVGPNERKPMNQRGFTHMALWVEDVDAVAERIVEFGGSVFPRRAST